MDSQTFFDNFATIADAPGGVQHLRDLVLELAVSGRLLEQQSGDEPVSDLLARIDADRPARNTLPQSAPLVPGRFEVPDTWWWLPLERFVHLEMGQSPPSSEYNQSGDGMPFFQGKADFGRDFPVARYWCTAPTKVGQPDDVLISVRAPVGPTNIADQVCCIGRGLAALRPLGGVPARFIRCLMQAFERDLAALGTGTTFIAISKKSLGPFHVPVPPLAEQERIVAKVDELMGLCDDLEARQERRHRTTTHFRGSALHALTDAETPDDLRRAWERISTNWPALTHRADGVASLRQTVVQLAVRGHLSDPGETVAGAADELVEATRKRRAEIEQERVLRGPKQLSAIGEVAKPFSIPRAWAWARFSDLGELARGRSQHRPRNDPTLYADGTIPLVQTGDVARAVGTIHTWSSAYNERGLEQSRLWPAGTLCITIAANIADSALLGFDACFPDSVVGFTPFEPISDARYFEYFMRTAKSDLELFAPSTAQKNINLAILDQLLIPLPPAEEMDRIVKRVESLLDLCDVLERRQGKRDTVSAAAAEAIAHAMAS